MALLLRWIPLNSQIKHTRKRNRNPPTFHKSLQHTLSISSPSHISRTPNHLTFSSPSSVTAVAASPETEPQTRLVASNIPWTCTAEDMKNLFQKHGSVSNVELWMYNKTQNRGLAFVTMGSAEEALEALNALNSYEFEGRIMKVELAKTQNKNNVEQAQAAVAAPRHDVFVANLSWKVKSKDLKEFFSSVNGNVNVIAAKVIHQSSDRRSTGYGFVSFGSEEEAKSAVSTFQGKVLMGRPIRVGLGRRSSGKESKGDVKAEDGASVVNGDRDQSDKTGEV
ncbi:hypothetical protein Sjap_010612 [Stephania japonica]|uniref:RRM domain-containing protein n=1 Tax=Stephania japonica TaxID=461633 RepID=A0AAP0JBJ4_9MAGN